MHKRQHSQSSESHAYAQPFAKPAIKPYSAQSTQNSNSSLDRCLPLRSTMTLSRQSTESLSRHSKRHSTESLNKYNKTVKIVPSSKKKQHKIVRQCQESNQDLSFRRRSKSPKVSAKQSLSL